jgi:hypothetical protein
MVTFLHKKAQSSMEILILMGFLTFIIIGILSIGYFYSSTINDRIKSSQLNNFANKITSTAETVFYAGSPSKLTIFVYLPEGVGNIQIIENNIVVTYNLSTGKNVISFPSNVPISENISAEISSTSGIKNIIIVANESHAIVSQN